MKEQYDTPSQLPLSLSPASLDGSGAGGTNSFSSTAFVTTTTPTGRLVGDGGGIQTTSLPLSLLTPPLSPISPIFFGAGGAYIPVHSDGSHYGNNDSAQETFSDALMSPPLLDNLMRVSKAHFTPVNPSPNGRNNGGGSARIHGRSFVRAVWSSSDELGPREVLSTPSLYLRIAPSPVIATPTILSPTRGTLIRGVAAMEVDCTVMDAGEEIDCIICFSSPDHLETHPSASLPPSELNQRQHNSGARGLHGDHCPSAGRVAVGGVRLHCRHTFHSNCLQRWLLNSRVCPLCRREVAFIASS